MTILKVKATQREQLTVQGIRYEFEPGEVKEIGPEVLARQVLRASSYLVEVEQSPHPVVEDDALPYDGPHADILGDVDPRVASDEEILAVDGIGPARLDEIREALG